MDTVKVGIIGIGNIGSAHASAVYSGEVDGMTLGALCDIDPVKREMLKEKYKEQLILYKMAVENAYKKPVEHMYIYSIIQ